MKDKLSQTDLSSNVSPASNWVCELGQAMAALTSSVQAAGSRWPVVPLLSCKAFGFL